VPQIKLTKGAQVIGRSVVRANHTSVSLGLAIASIIYCTRKGAGQPSPVVVRDEIPISIKGSLRLLVNDTEDLVNCGEPCTEDENVVHPNRIDDIQSAFIMDVSFVAS
jgi:hypothetical protein